MTCSARTTFPPAPLSRLRLCFQTDAEGWIPLRPDWSRLFTELKALDGLCLQVKHAYGRFAVKMPSSISFLEPPMGFGLRLYPARWAEAKGKLTKCPCCNSPGHIAFFNAFAQEVLQIAAASETPPERWAEVLATVAAPYEETSEKAPDERPPCTRFPLLPGGAVELPLRKWNLPEMLAELANIEMTFRVTFPTGEGILAHPFSAREIYLDGDQLVMRGPGAGLMVSLRATRTLATGITSPAGPLSLYLVGPDESLLASIEPADPSIDGLAWQAALEKAGAT